MLHQFNYSTPLSQFLSLHQSLTAANQPPNSNILESTTNENSSNNSLYDETNSVSYYRNNNKHETTPTKSFTIAAILGLHSEKSTSLTASRMLHSETTSLILNNENIIIDEDFDEYDQENDLANSNTNSNEQVINLSKPQSQSNVAFAAAAVLFGATTHPSSASDKSLLNTSGTVGATAQGSVTTTLTHQVSNSGSMSHQQHRPTPTQTERGTTLKNSSQSSSALSKKVGKSKRVRTIFTPEQLERLEAEFERQQYMVGPERLYLAHTLQLTEAQVKVWFQNRRIKWRKHHLEMTHQRLAVIKQQQLHHQLLDPNNPENVVMDDESDSSNVDDT